MLPKTLNSRRPFIRKTSVKTLASVAAMLCLATGCASLQKPDEGRRSSRYANDPAMPTPALRRPQARLTAFEDNGATTLATYKVMRHISMYYKLDLRRDNALSGGMAAVMRSQEDKIRQCYLSRLDEAPTLRGQMALTFLVAKAATGMRRVAQIGGNLTDRALLACITRELASLPLTAPRRIKGRLLYSFDVVESVAQAK